MVLAIFSRALKTVLEKLMIPYFSMASFSSLSTKDFSADAISSSGKICSEWPWRASMRRDSTLANSCWFTRHSLECASDWASSSNSMVDRLFPFKNYIHKNSTICRGSCPFAKKCYKILGICNDIHKLLAKSLWVNGGKPSGIVNLTKVKIWWMIIATFSLISGNLSLSGVSSILFAKVACAIRRLTLKIIQYARKLPGPQEFC